MTKLIRLVTPDHEGVPSVSPYLVAAQYAATLLNRSSVIAVPTDTVYGLACLAQDAQALKRLFQIKRRSIDKPVAICFASVEDIYKYCKVNVKFKVVLRNLLPGPVTFLFKQLADVCIVSNSELIGVRIPDNPFIMHLASFCNAPIALTSANRSGMGNCLEVEAFMELWPELEAVFDGGRLGQIDPIGLGSTIIDCSLDGSCKIVRDGCALSPVQNTLKSEAVITT